MGKYKVHDHIADDEGLYTVYRQYDVKCICIYIILGHLACRQPAGLITCLTPESALRRMSERERERESVYI